MYLTSFQMVFGSVLFGHKSLLPIEKEAQQNSLCTPMAHDSLFSSCKLLLGLVKVWIAISKLFVCHCWIQIRGHLLHIYMYYIICILAKSLALLIGHTHCSCVTHIFHQLTCIPSNMYMHIFIDVKQNKRSVHRPWPNFPHKLENTSNFILGLLEMFSVDIVKFGYLEKIKHFLSDTMGDIRQFWLFGDVNPVEWNLHQAAHTHVDYFSILYRLMR